jgi:hypothetical protein
MWRQKKKVEKILCGASASLHAAKCSKMDAFVVQSRDLQYQGGGGSAYCSGKSSSQMYMPSQRYMSNIC